MGRLSSERDNFRLYGLDRSTLFRNTSDDGHLPDPQDELSLLRSRVILQQHDFDAIAQRAQEKLLSQKAALDTAHKEVQDLLEALHDSESVGMDANKSLQEERRRRERAEAMLWSTSPGPSQKEYNVGQKPAETEEYGSPG